jgi:hypothetical protein
MKNLYLIAGSIAGLALLLRCECAELVATFPGAALSLEMGACG